MGIGKMLTYRTMMGGLHCSGVCVVILLVAAAQAAAQARANLQAADGTDERPWSLSKTNPVDVGMIGGMEVDGGKKLEVDGHTYKIAKGVSEGERQRKDPANADTGSEGKAWRGEATREGPRHSFKEVSDGVEEEQTSGVSDDEWSDNIRMNSPGEEDKHPSVHGDEPTGWSREADLWKYREGQWKEVRLPDPAYLSLPTPAPPAAALIVNTVGKVEVERRLEGLKDVTIYCRFYLSDSHHPDALPELEVYFVKDGSRKKLMVDTTAGAWKEQTIHVPEADNSSIIIEGWLKAQGDIIALSNLYTTGVTPARDEALDADLDQMTLAVNTTENVTSTFETEGLWNEAPDQDNTTRSSTTDDRQVNPVQSPADGDTEESTGTAMPSDEFRFDSSTDIPESAVQISEQVDGMTDVSLNTSMSGDDNMTSDGGALNDFNGMTTTPKENNDTDGEEKSTPATVTDGQSSSSENDTEEAFETSGKEGNSTTLPIPGVTTDSLQANSSVTLLHGNATAMGGPLITTEDSVNSETSSSIPSETRFTDRQNLSTNVFETGKGSSDTTLGKPDSNATSEYVTGDIELPGGVIMESTPPPAGNSTEAVVAVPVSSTSWQVFQIFLVLCVMGLLALGFLYWKRKRRQDDEIPVFTRHTDYPNPTFTMEDAANFMSRGGRNTYKTID